MLTAKEAALTAAKALDSKKGVDLRLLKIDRISSLADYFLICTGTSSTHVKTLCDSVEAAVADELNEPLLHREGHRGGLARSRPLRVAEGASADGNAAVAVGAGTARVQGDLADPVPETSPEIDREGMESVW